MIFTSIFQFDGTIGNVSLKKYGMYLNESNEGKYQESIISNITPDPVHHVGK